MTISRFEDIEVWKLSRKFVNTIYSITNNAHFSKDYGLREQLRRASISIMSNISEGFERKSKKEFIHFLYLSKGSAGEIRSQLYAALDLQYINNSDFERLFGDVECISNHYLVLLNIFLIKWIWFKCFVPWSLILKSCNLLIL